ncbi:MAG: methionyl-tRNA formyltransferase, partial [Clostridia bacterium]|nr:methionyl-tRNA formyltransferase [Clostridia bacterium]
MKVVFLGTPDFAVAALENIIKSRHEVVAVVTQPDRPKGRSGKPIFSPVKEVAVKHGINVLQYEKIRNEGVDELRLLGADIFVTCAYGQILSQEIIDIPRHGIINIHASLLPKYRGAAPIQWAVLNGDEYTGVTIMKTEAGVDTGA